MIHDLADRGDHVKEVQQEEFGEGCFSSDDALNAQESADIKSGGLSQSESYSQYDGWKHDPKAFLDSESDSGCESKGDSEPGDSEPQSDREIPQKRKASSTPAPVPKKQRILSNELQEREKALIKKREDQICELESTDNEDRIRELRRELYGIQEAVEWLKQDNS